MRELLRAKVLRCIIHNVGRSKIHIVLNENFNETIYVSKIPNVQYTDEHKNEKINIIDDNMAYNVLYVDNKNIDDHDFSCDETRVDGYLCCIKNYAKYIYLKQNDFLNIEGIYTDDNNDLYVIENAIFTQDKYKEKTAYIDGIDDEDSSDEYTQEIIFKFTDVEKINLKPLTDNSGFYLAHQDEHEFNRVKGRITVDSVHNYYKNIYLNKIDHVTNDMVESLFDQILGFDQSSIDLAINIIVSFNYEKYTNLQYIYFRLLEAFGITNEKNVFKFNLLKQHSGVDYDLYFGKFIVENIKKENLHKSDKKVCVMRLVCDIYADLMKQFNDDEKELCLYMLDLINKKYLYVTE